ncbi:MAG TPA: 50S ribosomal protein L4 [Spirochaetota bacterium]|nr:50S ribosomal protein L4 [Spirochaetota bacterium]HOM37915.1 50S ribosomal protein L4 [Spirochaetota bacterium]HPQ48719.1 50S ribosomal protein L4 [Spirochaetota bacterium]
MELSIYKNGNVIGSVNLSNIESFKVKKYLIHDKIKMELANIRVGTADTKTRGEVSGGGKKPWRQKGTGRARQGSIRSPLWVGGGVVFGPTPRDYGFDMPKKQKKLANMHTLIFKFKEGVVKIVEELPKTGKTKDMYKFVMDIIKKEERTIILFLEDDPIIKRAMRNIPWLSYMSVKRLASHELFYAKNVLIVKDAFEYVKNEIESVLGGVK